jgi:type II secretion system (T2SS) protein C
VSDAGLYASESAPPARSWRSRVVSVVSMLIALALTASVLAYWGWRWFGPPTVALPPERADGDAVRRIADAHLFGAAAPASASPDAPATGDLRLLGVFAERDGKGYALFRAGLRGPLFVAAGSEVTAGVRLDAVRPQGVTLMQDGVPRDMALRPAGASEKARTTVAQTSNRSAQCSPPAGFTGPILRLNAELLSGMIAAPDTWKALLQPGAGGLVVRDQSGFAGMMGLRNGDHVERANGIALALPEDIAATVLQPLTRSQPVWVSGTRDGKPQQWFYLNAGACPA